MKHTNVKRIISGVFAAAMVLSSVTANPTLTVKAATTVKLTEGTKYTIVSKSSGKALAVENDSKNNNAKIVQKTLNNSDSQIWTLDYDNNGYYQIINENSGKVLDVPNSSKKEGEQIIQWNKGNGNNQKWKITESGNGYYRISPKITSKYGLNVSKNSTNDNAKIQQWTYHGDANEQWEIREVSEKDTIRLEAENGTLRNGANIMSASKASGGKMVGNLNNDNSVEFKVNCDYDGSYTMNIYYATAEERIFKISNQFHNGSMRRSLYCDSTGGWNTVGKEEIPIGLAKGENIIKFSGSGYAPNIDYIEISGFDKAGNVTEKGVIRIEAESAEYLDGTRMNVPNASGGVIIGDLLDDYASHYAIYTGLPDGFYTMRIYYASAQDRKLYMNIDGIADHYYTVDCPSTGSWTKVGKPAELQVYVEEGFRLRFGGDNENNYAPNVDYFEFVKK